MTVAELLQGYAGGHVALLPNEGNCGDGLIDMGFRTLCQKYQISYTSLLHPREASGEVLFVLGCGNLCRPYHYQVARIQHYVERFALTFILPCSIDRECDEVAALLNTLPDSVVIFCREKYSFAQATEIVGNKNKIYIDHDLAFAVDYHKWQSRGSGNLFAFRTDRESLGHPLPPNNLDISLWGGSADGELLLRTVAKYRSVHSDRAHVTICAAMLGKETHIYPNNYHKVRGIYELSLAGRPNVTFHEHFPVNQSRSVQA